MRSRISIVTMLVLGAFLTLGGAALSFSGPSASRNAATAQYGHHHHHHNNNDNDNNNDNNNNDEGEVLGTSQAAPPATSTPGPSQGVLGETARPTAETQPAQAARQIQSTGARELPFTGYAAIPIMVVGLALLALGLLMRRTRTETDLS